MFHSCRLRVMTAALGVLAFPGGFVRAGDPEVEEFWDEYIRVVGCRDEVQVLACYDEDLRNQLNGDKTAAGRSRLEVHMGDLFEILQRNWDHKVVEEKRSGKKLTYVLQFKHRKDGREYRTTVDFVEKDGRWYIAKPPDTQEFLTASRGSLPMIAGIVIVIGVLAFAAKKLLGT